MKYVVLLSLILSISFAEHTLTDQQMEDLHLKIEQCKIYKEENGILLEKNTLCDSMIVDYETAMKLSHEQILKLEEINKDLVESQKGKWYESPYFIGILTFLLGTQLDFK